MVIQFTKENLKRLHEAKAILQKDLRYHYTIFELADKLGTNATKLKSEFKQLFHSTIFDYLTNIRIEKAKDLLKETDWPVKRICKEVGYNKPGNFTRRFKEITGQLPLEWRRQAKDEFRFWPTKNLRSVAIA